VNKNNNTQTVLLLSEAIVAVMADNQSKATKLVAQALQGLASTTPASKVTAPKRSKKATSKRGRRPALNPMQVANLNARVAAGDSISVIAKNFGVTYPTAHRYYQRALEVATAPSN
jgi:hypothetical protein